MAAEDEGRTEEPTGKKRGEARDKGNIPTSRELIHLLPVWVLFIFLSFKGAALFEGLLNYFRFSLKRSFEVSVSNLTLYEIFRTDAGIISGLMMSLFIWMPVLAVAIHMYQTDYYFSLASLRFDVSRAKMDPLKGIKRMFSMNTLFEVVKGMLKLTVLGVILYFLLKKDFTTLPMITDMELISIATVSFSQIRKLIIISVSVLSLFAIVDYMYQKHRYEDSLKMTKFDVKDEMKQAEGDPKVKARIRSLQREMAMRRMMAEVPKADVVITNPTHFAVALKYEADKMTAPRVKAKGANLIAQRIKDIAREHNVPIFEDQPLARTLFKLDLEQEIPELLYKAVATILANVYKLKGKVNRG